MRATLIISLLLILGLTYCKQNNWAVVVAGSNEFHNYRHQADIFHAYQLLVQNGISKDNIIVFAYDDIAFDPENPIQGKVFNKVNGQDVYAGVKIDYREGDVTPGNFLNVLKGKKDLLKGIGSGRVLKSTEEDNVFIYFSDHGSDKVLAFPDDYLFADDLQEALIEMHKTKMYKELVFYLEACFSGSMFEDLPTNLNIYATTAANNRQSSYAEFCPPLEDVVEGQHIGTCLGDEYSSQWMKHTEQQTNPNQINLHEQYSEIKKKTILSEVSQFGDLEMPNKSAISDFLYQTPNDNIMNMFHILKIKPRNLRLSRFTKKISSRYVKLLYLENKARSNDYEASIELEKERQLIAKSQKIFDSFTSEFNLPESRNSLPVDYNCLKKTLQIYKETCGFNERDIEHLHNFATVCAFNPNMTQIKQTIKTLCSTFN